MGMAFTASVLQRPKVVSQVMSHGASQTSMTAGVFGSNVSHQLDSRPYLIGIFADTRAALNRAL